MKSQSVGKYAEQKRSEERGTRLDTDLYTGSRIQAWSSDLIEEDDFDETDYSGRLFNRIYNPTRISSPFLDSSSFLYEHPRTTDIFGELHTIKRKTADLDYEIKFYNPGPSSRAYRPRPGPPLFQDYIWDDVSYVVEAARGPRGNVMLREDKNLRDGEEERRREELRERAEEEEEERERQAAEQKARKRFEKALQEEAEAKAATSKKVQEEAERLWRAENPNWTRAHLHGMYSFTKLYNKDTISRDSTIGNEARMDDLLACVGKRMMSTHLLKGSHDESSHDGEELDGNAIND
ncbi:hypothetical protein FANTH_1554 [Fusarium anthophilum]|uniref:Uncharacterized protein n=1 Tax=Fusarium anthophilum TaxID=48485 RepID=A0A8H4ZVE3_9HYPO|nr:hypothetical protein FANTH_1554 [Fusarium anthophilum]